MKLTKRQAEALADMFSGKRTIFEVNGKTRSILFVEGLVTWDGLTDKGRRWIEMHLAVSS